MAPVLKHVNMNTHEEEKGDTGRAGRLRQMTAFTLKAQQDTYEHHAESQQGRSDHHRVPSTVSIQKEGWE